MTPLVHLNYYKNNRSDITYEPVTRNPDLEKVKPIYVTPKELEEIKTCTVDLVMKILDDNKF